LSRRKNPNAPVFLKFSIVFGAASFQNCTTISPSLVLITATSLDAFIVGFSAFFSPEAKTADPSNSATAKIDDFTPTSGTNAGRCHIHLLRQACRLLK